MFCKSCGTQISDGVAFCGMCGQKNTDVGSAVNPVSDNNVIDLTGQAEKNKPLEQRYKSITALGGLMLPLFVIMVVIGRLLCDAFDSDQALLSLLITAIPLLLISALMLSPAKRKALQTERVMDRGFKFFVYGTSIFITSLTMLCGVAPAFSEVGVMPVILLFFFIPSLIVFYIMCYMMSIQHGEEGYYCLVKALLTAAILSVPIAYVLGLIMRALEIGMLIILILLIIFISGGGRLIVVKTKTERM